MGEIVVIECDEGQIRKILSSSPEVDIYVMDIQDYDDVVDAKLVGSAFEYKSKKALLSMISKLDGEV